MYQYICFAMHPSRGFISLSELESSSQEELNNSEIIDELFKDVLDMDDVKEEIEHEAEAEDRMVVELDKPETEEQSDEAKSENEVKEKKDELTLPRIAVVSPLAKSIKLDAMAPLVSTLRPSRVVLYVVSLTAF